MATVGVVEVTHETFESEVLGAAGAVLVEFGADWCAPCRRLAPMLKDLAEAAQGTAKIVTIDTDANPQLREQYQISAIPTVVVFRDGAVVKKLIGVMSRAELDSALQQAVSA